MRRPLFIATTAGVALAAGLIGIPSLAGAATGPWPGVPSGPGTGATPNATATCPYGGPYGGPSAPATGGPGAGGRPGAGNGPGMMGGRSGDGTGMMGRGPGGHGAGMTGGPDGRGRGAGMMGGRSGDGAGMMGRGARGGAGTTDGTAPGWCGGMTGTGDPLTGLAKGSLTADQKAELAGMAEEEKLAHDVYVALAARHGDVRFSRIAAAESRHLAAVRALMTRYGVTDPTAGKADGQFASADVGRQYQDLVARGSVSLDAALGAGRDIENADLKDLTAAASGVTAQDVVTVYGRLTDASRRHLRAFGG